MKSLLSGAFVQALANSPFSHVVTLSHIGISQFHRLVHVARRNRDVLFLNAQEIVTIYAAGKTDASDTWSAMRQLYR